MTTLNTQVLAAVKHNFKEDWNSNPKMLEDLNKNKPVAISYSMVEGLCSLYASTEAAHAAYNEALAEGNIQNVILDLTGLIVSGKFPIPADSREHTREIYQATCEVISELGGVEFIPSWDELHSRASQ